MGEYFSEVNIFQGEYFSNLLDYQLKLCALTAPHIAH